MRNETKADGRVVLWQLQISHYNEKVRWALDFKRIPHTRRSLLPVLHALTAKRLSGGMTTPVLTLDGESIGDSTRIIAAVEKRWPEPALYPEDPAERKRALELEDFFDEELGPHIRRGIYDELLEHPELAAPMFANGQALPGRTLVRMMFPALRLVIRRRFRIDPESAERSRAKAAAAMDVLEAEIGPGGYLVGESFSVADLTAAALFYPVVRPAEYPYPLPTILPDRARELIEPLAERPGAEWVADMYRRHRRAPVGTMFGLPV